MKKNKNKQIIEGSKAIALTIKSICPDVISAYPITPQTHIVEDLSLFKAEGLANYEYIRAESEFAAASIVLGASAAGARTYSATSSQGLLLMTEVLYNISGLRLPIVITCANRAISSPINIWNDHSDAMAVRDSGWLQFFAEDHQEAVYQHILAYKIAEMIDLPILVNVDGFILTHSYEPVLIPKKEIIKKYLGTRKLSPNSSLDPKNPITMGGFFSQKEYFLTRQNLYEDSSKAILEIKKEYIKLKKIFNFKDNNNGLVEYSGSKNPKVILIAMGSVIGTMKETIKKEKSVGIIKVSSFRPFPYEDIKKLVKNCLQIAVLDKAISPGSESPLYSEVKSSLMFNPKINIKNYLVGLGGTDVSEKIILQIIKDTQKKGKLIKFMA